jgi:hypothetical protein
MKRIGLVTITIITLLMIIVLAGCSKSAPTAPANADTITEKLLLAYDAKDYRAYLEVFDEYLTGSVGMDWFEQTVDFNTLRIGHYIAGSIALQDVLVKEDTTEVTYTAQYTDAEGDVKVIVSLDITDHGTFATGIWITSPDLYK